MMTSKKKYLKIISTYQSMYKPEHLWEFLVHPKYTVAFTKDPCYYNKIDDDFILKKDDQWTELHNGEHCDGDVVICTIKDLKKNEFLTEVRHQTGIKNTITRILEENEKGTLVTEKHKFTFSFKKFRLINLVNWIFLVTGLLTKFSYEPEDDEYWFEKMEQKAKENYNGI